MLPLHPTVVRWWHEAGGDAVTFGSDAHEPAELARRFREASAPRRGLRLPRRVADPHALWPTRRLTTGVPAGPQVELSG